MEQPSSTIHRFHSLSLGDSVLQRVELKIPEAECLLQFQAGNVLKEPGSSIFEPVARFAPAHLRLLGVRTIWCEGGTYQLNSTVVDFGAAATPGSDAVEFYFDLTGGLDPAAFLVRIRILAKDFTFTGVECP